MDAPWALHASWDGLSMNLQRRMSALLAPGTAVCWHQHCCLQAWPGWAGELGKLRQEQATSAPPWVQV
jgi:hypothetical protein